MPTMKKSSWPAVACAAVLAAAAPSAAQQAGSDRVVAPPPSNIAFSMVFKTKTPRPAPQTPTDPEAEMLMPSGEAEHENRRVEYVIAGDRCKMTTRQGGETSTRYYLGNLRIMKSSNGKTPYVTDIKRDYSHADDHFRDEFPFTNGFQPSHLKGTTTIDGRPALLYERDATAPVGQEDDLNPSTGPASNGERLYVDAGNRLPLRVEGDGFVVRFSYKDSASGTLVFPEEYENAVNKYILGSRVERAKPY
jgi:hypothetical protein